MTQANKLDDREKIIEMLNKVVDKASLSIYKKINNISDEEIENKRKCTVKEENEAGI